MFMDKLTLLRNCSVFGTGALGSGMISLNLASFFLKCDFGGTSDEASSLLIELSGLRNSAKVIVQPFSDQIRSHCQILFDLLYDSRDHCPD